MKKRKKWLDSQEGKITEYGKSSLIALNDQDIKIVRNQKKKEYDTAGTTVYISAVGMEYCKVFDMDGKAFSLKAGQAAMTRDAMERNHLETGDKIVVSVGDTEKELTVSLQMKDAAFGNDMSGMNRIILSSQDYDVLHKDQHAEDINMYLVMTEDETEFVRTLNDQDFTTVLSTVTKGTYDMIYSFDMIMAALLILVGICLILIALLVLRFTLVFTMEEEYREIGIMKAVGIPEFYCEKGVSHQVYGSGVSGQCDRICSQCPGQPVHGEECQPEYDHGGQQFQPVGEFHLLRVYHLSGHAFLLYLHRKAG